MRRFLAIAFFTLSLERQLTTLQQHFTFGNFELDMIQLIPKKARICLGFRAKSLPFSIAYRFAWSEICFTSSFKFVVLSNISNELAFSEISNNTCASGVFCFDKFRRAFPFQFRDFLCKFFYLVAHLYPRLDLRHGLLLLVLEVDGFILYCSEFALLLCILCQNLLKAFSQSHFIFC